MHNMARTIKDVFQDFISDENGATAIEYALMAALLGISIIIGGKQVGDAINAKFVCTSEVLDSDTLTAECSS